MEWMVHYVVRAYQIEFVSVGFLGEESAANAHCCLPLPGVLSSVGGLESAWACTSDVNSIRSS